MKRYFTASIVLITLLLTTNSYASEQLFRIPEKSARNVRDCQKEDLSLKELSKRGVIDIGNWHGNSWDNPFLIEIDDQVDLNNDGVCEIRIINKTASNQGGNVLSFYQKSEGAYKKIISIFGYNVSFLEEKNGYTQVQYHYKVSGNNTGSHLSSSSLLFFDGKKYARIKIPQQTAPKNNMESDESAQPLNLVGKGCMNGRCHQELQKLKYTHGPIAAEMAGANGCKMCHVPSGPECSVGKAGSYKIKFKGLCSTCHGKGIGTQHSSDKVIESKCLLCHYPHGSNISRYMLRPIADS